MQDPDAELTLCAHCGAIVPRYMLEADSSEQFCCAGCRAVYAVIKGAGFGHFYDLRAKDPLSEKMAPVLAGAKSYEHYDQEAFQNCYVRRDPASGGLATTELYLEGVHCAACVWLIERLPRTLDGVEEIALDYTRSLARVYWDPARCQLSRIAATLDSFGYRPHPFRAADRHALRSAENRKLLIKIGLAAAVAGNVMLIAICLYAGEYYGISGELESLLRWVSLVISAPSVLYSGSLFYRSAFTSLKLRSIHLDVPISLGIWAGFLYSAVNVVLGRGSIYFDSITLLIFLLLLSRWLQFRGQSLASERAEQLFSYLPTAVRRVKGSLIEEVALESLEVGDTIEVLPNEVLPVDGDLLSTRVQLDTRAITGESAPRTFLAGERVHAGMYNGQAPVLISVSATGEETRLGKLLQFVEQTIRQRPASVQLADRIGPQFVFVVMCVAAAAFVLGAYHSTAEAIERAIAVLIVCCPCALGLGGPLALSAAMGRAAANGIFVKSPVVFERIAIARRILFDKTGTLTSGDHRLQRCDVAREHLEAVLSLELHSAHVLARSLCRALQQQGVSPNMRGAVTELSEVLGRGISGRVDGVLTAVGSLDFMESRQVSVAKAHREIYHAEALLGRTPLIVEKETLSMGVISLGDSLREGAKELIEHLRNKGYQLFIVSGDRRAVVSAIGRDLGFSDEELIAEAGPEKKIEIAANPLWEPVIMLGDGINDAGALAAAGVGVAVHGGAEASLIAADIFFAKPKVQLLLPLIRGAKDTMMTIRRNLQIALGYNLVGGVLAMLGFITPLAAALLMPLSSFSVLLSSLRVFSRFSSKDDFL